MAHEPLAQESILTFSHFSDTPLRTLFSVTQCDRPMLKPRGLWISDETDYGWKQWCQDNAYGCGTIETQITLVPTHRLLCLTSSDALHQFTHTYGEVAPYSSNGLPSYIRWAHVARQYQGILITPYQWACRLNHTLFWYYGWDCAAGCIWDIRAVATYELR